MKNVPTGLKTWGICEHRERQKNQSECQEGVETNQRPNSSRDNVEFHCIAAEVAAPTLKK